MWLAEELEIPEKTFPLRLRYMYHDRLCTVIDVEERQKRIKIKNFVQDPVFCAFQVILEFAEPCLCVWKK